MWKLFFYGRERFNLKKIVGEVVVMLDSFIYVDVFCDVVIIGVCFDIR